MLEESIEQLTGVGPKLSQKLAKCGLHSLKDLLMYLPHRYQDRTRVTALQDARSGDHILVQAQIVGSQLVYGRKAYLKLVIDDGSALADVLFFHFNKNQRAALSAGQWLRLFGQIKRFSSKLSMVHPEYELMEADSIGTLEETLTPIYPATEGLSQKKLRSLIQQAWDKTQAYLDDLDLLKDKVKQDFQFPSLKQALKSLHFPTPDIALADLIEGQHPAIRRLAFEELLAYHLCMLEIKKNTQKHFAYPCTGSSRLVPAFIQQLNFQLTNAQRRVVDEIFSSMSQPYPMQRLVQGDVGSGKTVVAAMTALQVVEAQKQVALMAPTEILAEQLFMNFSGWGNPLGVRVALLTGRTAMKKRQGLLQQLKLGEIDIIIGTHALFQDDLVFKDLAYVIIDEQHRFGVEQRLALSAKGARGQSYPHQLFMSATPIPRTLAMILYADLDVSTIDERPAGRMPIQTVVMSNEKRESVVERLRNNFQQGRQAYWVCTLIEESEQLECEAAEELFDYLSQSLAAFRVGLVHGRMKSQEKEAMMGKFKQGEIDLLVATTVIEVGVDVPNATVMVIENPERLGLSQLHQLRGRVGRGDLQSYCVLLFNPPLSPHSRERLAVIRDTDDGFIIARKDLELRGPGEILGKRQTGDVSFKFANLERDQAMIQRIPGVAKEYQLHNIQHIKPLIKRWFVDKLQFLKG